MVFLGIYALTLEGDIGGSYALIVDVLFLLHFRLEAQIDLNIVGYFFFATSFISVNMML